MNDILRYDRRPVEQEAAFKLSQLARREFGLSPSEADGALNGDLLTVRLRHALTPMGRVIARSADGGKAVQSVYAVLHESYHAEMERMMARIVGVPVRGSWLEVDMTTEDVVLGFRLDLAGSSRSAQRG